MKILLVGGGSGGPVAPLLAVAAQIKKTHPQVAFLLVGTKLGPERGMAERAGIEFTAITSGKWRRYFSFANFFTPFAVIKGLADSWRILNKFKPDCVFGAGSFVQVPVVWAAKFRGIPVVLHQQDLLPGLANQLCEYAATKITVTFADSLTDFSSGLGLFYRRNKAKILLTGNPFRHELAGVTKEQGLKAFDLRKDLPVLLVLGGGTGAQFFNDLVARSLPELGRTVQVIHSTGAGKSVKAMHENYHPREFIGDMGAAYAAADIVLARAGLSTITELANLEKFAVIVPMPDSHQELNAYLLFQEKAAIILHQDQLTPDNFSKIIRKILFDFNLQKELKASIAKIMPRNSAAKIADIIIKLAESHAT